MKHLVTILAVFLAIKSYAQQGTSGQDKEILTVVEQPPSFVGGPEAMYKFIGENFKYPIEALQNEITGSVFVQFVVNENGAVSDAKVIKGIGDACDQEALRIVNLMPNWNPGKQDGKPVSTRFVLPFRFKSDLGLSESPLKEVTIYYN